MSVFGSLFQTVFLSPHPNSYL